VRRTRIGILEIGLIGGESRVDDGLQALIESHGTILQNHILGRHEIIIRAHNGIGAVRAPLQPGLILTSSSNRDSRHRDQLEAIQRRLHCCPIPQFLTS